MDIYFSGPVIIRMLNGDYFSSQIILNFQVISLKFSRTMSGEGFKWPGVFIDGISIRKRYPKKLSDYCRVVFFSPLRQVRVAATNIMPGLKMECIIITNL